MIVTATAKRYARALFELAREKKCLDQVRDEFTGFLAMVKKDEALQRLLKLPGITRRQHILIQYLKDSYSDIFYSFILLVLKNNRYPILPQILHNYLSQHDKFNNIIRAEVVTATALTDNVSSDLVQQLKAYYNADVRITNKVDASILGGIIVRVNGRIFNASVQEKFNKMKTYLTKN